MSISDKVDRLIDKYLAMTPDDFVIYFEKTIRGSRKLNFNIWLDNIVLESYPLITNARLNVTITHIIDTDGHKGYAQTCDSDWNYYSHKELEFEPEFGETKKSNGKWVNLSADQMYDICEEYEAEIVNQLWEYIEELKEDY